MEIKISFHYKLQIEQFKCTVGHDLGLRAMNSFGQYKASAHSAYLEIAWTIYGDFNKMLLVDFTGGRTKLLHSNDILIAIAVCSAPVK